MGLKVDIAINSEHEPLPDAGKVPVPHSLTSVVFGELACYYSTFLALGQCAWMRTSGWCVTC